MADCYYHGQSSPGSCGKCDRNTNAGRDASDDGDYPKVVRPKVGDEVIASRKGNSFEKGTIGRLTREGGIDSENYYFIETQCGRIIGPSLEDYWEKHTKE